MNSSQKLFEDMAKNMAKMASTATATFTGFKEEVETMVRQQMERLLGEMDVTPREEFEAVRDMAAKSRAEQQKLEKRIAKLEAKLAVKTATKNPPTKKTASKAVS